MIYFILSVITIFIIYYISLKEYRSQHYMNKYKIILGLFSNFLDSAYQIIYSEHLMIYTTNGTTQIQKDQLETYERNFIKLTLELMGKQNKQRLIDFFGDESTLIVNILMYFRQKLDQDELSKMIRTASNT